MSAERSEKVKVHSSDGIIFEIELQEAKCFFELRMLFEKMTIEEIYATSHHIHIRSTIFEKLLQYVNHHPNDELRSKYFPGYKNRHDGEDAAPDNK